MNYNNFAQKTNFIATSDKFENLPFLLTNINIPGINLSHPELSSRSGAKLKVTGDTLTYNNLNVDMLIDEDFHIYQELMSIIKKNINVETSTFNDFYFDFYIEMNNSKGNKIFKLNFFNCRIESIGDIELSTQDESTEIILSLSMIYDYYTIDQMRVFKIINDNVVQDIPVETETIIENFENFDNWVLWGYPTPILVEDGMSTNGAGLFGSGVVSHKQLATDKPFEVMIRCKQDIVEDNYLEVGITEGPGIETTSNGRTGKTVMGVRLDSEETSRIRGENLSGENDGNYHDYTFKYEINERRVIYSIYKDSTLLHTLETKMSNYDNFHVYIQGMSNNNVSQVLFTT